MKHKCLSLVLVAVLICLAPASRFAQNNVPDKGATIKAKVEKRVRDGKTSVVVELPDGTKIKGKITSASNDSFTLVGSKTNQSTVFAYRDVAKVKGTGWPKSAKIALGVGIAAAATLTILYIAFQNAIRDN